MRHQGLYFYNGMHVGRSTSPFALTEALLSYWQGGTRFETVVKMDQPRLLDGLRVPSLFT